METRCTRGPWVKDYRKTLGHIKSTGVGNTRSPTVCKYDILPDELMSAAEKEANGRLISAAPDLYEALEQASEILHDLIDDGDCFLSGTQKKCRAALAKARGETMSEVKAQGAPGRIWLIKGDSFGLLSDFHPHHDDDIEYIRADIARELAEALQMAIDDDDIAGLENSGSISKASRSKVLTSLAKWREATEKTE